MKAGMDLEQFSQKVMADHQSKNDFLVDTRALDFDAFSDSLELNTEESLGAEETSVMNIHEHTHGQIANRTGVPKKFYDRLKREYPENLNRVVNDIFSNEPEKRLIRELNGTARAFLSDQYRRIDNWDVLSTVLPYIKDSELEIQSCHVGFSRMYLKATIGNKQKDIEVGDPVKAGVVISNSEVGAASAEFQPMLFRLVCKNGMIRKEHGIKQKHLGSKLGHGDDSFVDLSDRTKRIEDRLVTSKMQDIMESLTEGGLFEKLVNECREARGREVEADPQDFVEKLGDDEDLTEEVQDSIVAEIARSNEDLTQFGVAQDISRVSQDFEDYDTATELEHLSGEVLSWGDKEWNRFSTN